MDFEKQEQIRMQVEDVADALFNVGPLGGPDEFASERIVASADDDWIHDLLDYIRQESAARIGTAWPDFGSALRPRGINPETVWRSEKDHAMLDLWIAWMKSRQEEALVLLPGLLMEEACRPVLIESLLHLSDADRLKCLRSLVSIGHDLSDRDVRRLLCKLSPRKSEVAKQIARELGSTFRMPEDAEKVEMLNYFLTDADFTAKYGDSPIRQL